MRTPEIRRTNRSEIRLSRRVFLAEDMRIKHWSQQQGYGRFDIEICWKLAARDAATENFLNALARGFGDTMTPLATELGVKG